MSVQFGRWNFDGRPPDKAYMERAANWLVPFGPDGVNSFSENGLTIVYRAFHTTKESRTERQPHVSKSGEVLTWDGYLDNRQDIRELLSLTRDNDCPDVHLAATAYERWGEACFSKLIGDWALSVWSPREQSLVMAKDPIGTRPLYYELTDDAIIWSSLLDPLVLCADRPIKVSEEYIAGWISFFPAVHLTPYDGFCSVPPSSFVRVSRNALTIHKYWNFDHGKRIRYGKDAEYEEHFRDVFGQAVERRLRSDNPVIAELSGGMDSSSIVCMADRLITTGRPETPRLDTISYYCDSEPNWNERPYFATVEEQRGHVGCHIDLGADPENPAKSHRESFAVLPGSRVPLEPRFSDCMRSGGYRVVLSGIGGDEITGGVPTPRPELQDLLASGRIRLLAHQLMTWAVDRRKPWLHLLAEALEGFLPATLRANELIPPAPWLRVEFAKRHRMALSGYPLRLNLCGPPPSFQENLATLETLRRQLGCGVLPPDPLFEKRYPYLDRSFLEFMYAIPREQLVRPGQRRSLMRRALVGIVPDAILQRKRKAFVTRSPLAALANDSGDSALLCNDMISEALDIVDADALCRAVQAAVSGQEIALVTLIRTLEVEFWLRGIAKATILRTFVFPDLTGPEKSRMCETAAQNAPSQT